MDTREGSAGVVDFMTPRIGVLMLRHGHGSDIVNMYCLFGGLLLYSLAWIGQIEGMMMMS